MTPCLVLDLLEALGGTKLHFWALLVPEPGPNQHLAKVPGPRPLNRVAVEHINRARTVRDDSVASNIPLDIGASQGHLLFFLGRLALGLALFQRRWLGLFRVFGLFTSQGA